MNEQSGSGGLLLRHDVERLTRLSTTRLYLAMSEGRFPRPVRIRPGRVAWVASEIDAWIAARVAERDQGARNAAAGAKAKAARRATILAALA